MSYLFPTMHLHATATSVYSKYTVNEDRDTVHRQPNHDEVLGTLVHAHALYIEVLKAQIEVFDLPLSDKLHACGVALPGTWNLGKEGQ
jgi:hypothetical protein